MSRPLLLSGKTVGNSIFESLIPRIRNLKDKKVIPSLAVILVGDNPASRVYVNSKTKTFKKLGLNTKTYHLPATVEEDKLLNLIEKLNFDIEYHGILVQLPLPEHINSDGILKSILPKKDVDGFHPENAGLLAIGRPRFIPCTPKGILRILPYSKIDLRGKHIVVLGRSNIVGRPISILTSLKTNGANGTTTICHSGTSDIESYTINACVIIAALGVPGFLTANMVKNEAIVVDVGINRIDDNSERGYKLVGDVKWDEVSRKVSAITPVPGGVGPMTIAMLVENTIEAAENISNNH